MTLRTALIFSLLGALLALTAACDGPATPDVGTLSCGVGDAVELEGDLYCLYDGGIIEEGFRCPSLAPHRFDFGELVVCSPDDPLPAGVEDELRRRGGLVDAPDVGSDVPVGDDAGDDAPVEPDVPVEDVDLPDVPLGVCEGGALALDANRLESGEYGLRVSAAARDQAQPACNRETWHNGRDALVSFTAPAAGRWLLWAHGDQLWTFSARTSCEDRESEVGCNRLDDFHGDDPFGPRRGFTLELAAGETIWLVLDGCPVADTACSWELRAVPPIEAGAACTPDWWMWPTAEVATNDCTTGTFCQRLEPDEAESPSRCVSATPPAFTEGGERQAWRVDGTLRVVVDGEDASRDMGVLLGTLLDAQGQPITVGAFPEERYLWPANDELYNNASFTILAELDEPADAINAAASVRLRLRDSQELLSEPIVIPISEDIPRIADGAVCDRHEIRNLCVEGDICSGNRGGEVICTTPTPPTITDARAFISADAGALGLQVSGTDPNDDAARFYLELFDAEDGSVALASTGVQELLGAEGSFSAKWSQPWFMPLGTAVRAVLTLEDRLGLRSAPMMLTLSSPDLRDRGEGCDPNQALDVCSGGDLCDSSFNTENIYDFRCHEPIIACPADWTLIDLNTFARDDGTGVFWWEGMFDGTAPQTRGRCNYGRVSEGRFQFTAPATGRYEFGAYTFVEPNAALHVRTHCLLGATELSCNGSEVADYHGGITTTTVALEAGQTVFVFTGDYVAPRPYRLVITPLP